MCSPGCATDISAIAQELPDDYKVTIIIMLYIYYVYAYIHTYVYTYNIIIIIIIIMTFMMKFFIYVDITPGRD